MVISRRAILASLAAAPLCEISACKRSSSTIRFGIPAYQDSFVPLYGDYAGWFKAEHLDLQFIILEIEEIHEALAGRSIDVAWSTESNTIVASVKNPTVRYVYPLNIFDNGFALNARPNGPIKPLGHFLPLSSSRSDAIEKTAAQLRGRTIITTALTDMGQAVASVVARGRLDYQKDIHVINLPPNEGLAAFLRGEGDAYMGGIPQRDRADAEGMIEVLGGIDLGPPPVNGLVTSSQFLQDREDELLRIMKVWFRIVTFGDQNPDALGTFIIAQMKHRSGVDFSLPDFRRAWQGLEKFVSSPQYAQDRVFSPDGDSYWRRRWDDSNHYFHDIVGVIPVEVAPDPIYEAITMQRKYLAKYG